MKTPRPRLVTYRNPFLTRKGKSSRSLIGSFVAGAILLGGFSLQATLLDDFNDNIKTAWTDTANGGTVDEALSVFTITTTGSAGALTSSKKTSTLLTNAAGHTIEVRVNVNSITPDGNGHAVLGWVPSGALNSSGYSVSVGTTNVTIYRAGVSIYNTNLPTPIQSTNLLVVMRMTTSGGTVSVKASVYRKSNGPNYNILFFEQTYSDGTGILGSGNAALGALNSPSGAAASAVFDDLKAFDIINSAYSTDFSASRVDLSNPSAGVYVESDGWIDYRPVNGNATNGTINNTNVPGELEIRTYDIASTYLQATYYNGSTFKISDGSRLEFEADIKTGSGNPVIIPLVSYLPNGLPDLGTLATYFLGICGPEPNGSVVAGKSASLFWIYNVCGDTTCSDVKSYNVRLFMHMSGEGTAVRIEQRIENLDVADVNDPARVILTTSYLDSTTSYINKNGYLCLLVYHDDAASAGNFITMDNAKVNRTAPGNVPPVIGSLSPGDGATFSTATNITFTVADDVNTPRNNIVLTLNGVTYSNGLPNVSVLPTSSTSTLRTFTLSNLTVNTYYNGNITATDNQGASSTVHYEFDTFSTTNLTVEIEDYNYSTNGTEGGEFIDNPVPSDTNNPASYYGLTGLQDIDFHDNRTSGTATFPDVNHYYRPDNPRNYNTADGPRSKYGANGATERQLAVDVENGDWANYSRTFPAGTYNVYLREANYNMAYMLTTLERVTSDPKVGSQTSRLLGHFLQLGGVAGDSGYDVHRLVPLTDASGNRVLVRFAGGVDTVRLRDIFTDFHSDTFQNYMVFAKVADPGTLRPVVALASPIESSSTRMSSMPEETSATIARRDTTVNVGTVALQINGAAIPSAVVTSDGDGGAKVTWSLTNVPGARVITNTVTFADSDGTNLTYSWTYSYPFVSMTNRLALGALPLRGFAHRTAQDDTASGDSLIRTEAQLAIPPEAPVTVNFSTNVQTLDWNDAGPNYVPGLDPGGYNYIATEDLAYLELKAGGHRFRVDSDDGFQLRAGHTPTDLNATILAQSDGDTFGGTFDFVVEADGLYPIRNIWYEQEGGAAFLLRSYNFDTSANVVVNDPGDPAGVVKAYLPTIVYSASTVTGPYTADANAIVNNDSKTVTLPQSGDAKFYRLYAPTGVTITSIVVSGGEVVMTYQ